MDKITCLLTYKLKHGLFKILKRQLTLRSAEIKISFIIRGVVKFQKYYKSELHQIWNKYSSQTLLRLFANILNHLKLQFFFHDGQLRENPYR